MNTHRGFSVLELSVCLALSAIVGAASFVAIPALVRQHRLCGETRRLQLIFERARARALMTGLPHSVALGKTQAILRAPNMAAVESLFLRHGVTLESASSSAQAVFFYPSHAASAATLLLRLGDLSSSIIISLRARTRSVC